jgi:hypothetical protein
MFSVHRLELLEVADKDDKRARAELGKGRLQTSPHLCVDLAHFVQDDEIIVP